MSFSSDINHFFEVEVRDGFSESVGEVAGYTMSQLQAKSPVDTGAFRANHNVSVGSPDFSFSKSKTNANTTIPDVEPGEPIFLANGAPYGSALEGGHSNQAPSGVYGLAAQSARGKYGV